MPLGALFPLPPPDLPPVFEGPFGGVLLAMFGLSFSLSRLRPGWGSGGRITDLAGALSNSILDVHGFPTSVTAPINLPISQPEMRTTAGSEPNGWF